MLKTNLLLAVLASAFVFGGCKKDEKKADEAAPKATETAAADPAGDTPAAEEKPADEQPAAEAEATGDTAGDMSREEVAEKAVGMFSKMAEVVKGAEGDCAKIATGLTSTIEEAKPIMEAGKKFEDNEEDKKWFEDTYGEKIKGIMEEMMGGMGECMNDPAVQQAFAGLE